jgi:hypothetical protein
VPEEAQAVIEILFWSEMFPSPQSNRTQRPFSRAFLLLAASCFLGLLSTGALFGAIPVSVTKNGTVIQFANEYLARTIDFGGGTVRTIGFLNKISGRFFAVRGDEFELRLSGEQFRGDGKNPITLTSRDFHLVAESVVNDDTGGKRVVFHLIHAAYPEIDATLIYQLEPKDFYTRKWMKLETKKKGNLFLNSVAVEKNNWYPGSFSLGGFGQPLLADDLFAGLEYPSSYNTAVHSSVTLGYFVGINLSSSESFASATAVIGVAAAGSAHIAFMEYINRIRMSPPHPFIVFEPWDDLPGSRLTGAAVINDIAEVKENLVDKYGVRLDSVVLDDGWDDLSKLWAIDMKRFPDGFHSVEASADGVGRGLGLWFSPMGGYGERARERIAEGIRERMEVDSSGQFFCLAGRKYSQFFREISLKMEKQHNINYFKMDGSIFTCNNPDHGHPLGVFSREAAMRDWITTLKALHAANPQAFLANATGPWLSPWWLIYSDDVDYGGSDVGFLETVPTLTPRQASINDSDAVLYQDFRAKQLQFPISSLDAVGIHKGKFNFPEFEHESLEDWTDAVVNCLATGVMKIDLYVSPQLLSPADWAVLGRALQWARRNAHPLYDNSTMVLGDPARAEAYGYLHYSPTKTIIALRNPFVRPLTVNLRLDTQNGFERNDHTYQPEVVFPYREFLRHKVRYGESLNVDLDGYEQCVIELRPDEKTEPTIAGVRYAVVPSEVTGEVQYRLYGAEGKTIPVQLTHASSLKGVRIGGRETKPNPGEGKITLPVHFGRASVGEDQPAFSVPTVNLAGAPGAFRGLTVSTTVHIPSDFKKSELAILLKPARPTLRVTATGTLNGKRASVATESGGAGLWYWFTMDLKPGRSDIDFGVHLPATVRGEAKISEWLRAQRSLATTDLILTLDSSQRAGVPLHNLLPANSEVEGQTYLVFEDSIH